MGDIVVFGVGQLAETLSVYLKRHSEHRIAAYTVDRKFREQDEFQGKPVLAWESLEESYTPDEVKLFCPMGYRDLNRARREKFLEGKRRGYDFISFVHPSSHVYAERVGENCVVLEQCVLQPHVTVGDNVIMWSSTHVGHHSEIGDHCFLAGGGGVAGNCKVGEGTFLGGGATMRDNRRIGRYCIVGMGAIVLQNVPDDSFVTAERPTIKPGVASRFARRLLG